MNTILTKLKDFVGINEPDEYDDYEEWERYPDRELEEPAPMSEEELHSRRRSNREFLNLATEPGMEVNTRNNVIGMPGISNGVAEVVVIEPHSFEEMPQVIQTLRERKSVVLNLNAMNPTEAQRAVDFVAGGTYAIDGHQERIGESIFLFTPNCVKVSTLEGTVHDVPEVQKSAPKNTTPNPTWAADVSRLAQ